MSASGRKLAKRACDGCKIRKIKCTVVVPCEGCVAAGIACTFVKQPSIRGPRRLTKSTLREIAQSQQQWEDLGFGTKVPDQPVDHTKLDAEYVFAPNKVAALVLQLCVYRLRMYPVWPIIKVERLVASLQRPEPDIEVFGLAYAVAAATIVRIRSKSSTQPGAVTAEMMEAQCQYAKVRRNKRQPPDLTTVRIPFFLHMYHENLEPGGLQSLTYLREAIAVAHMIGLHRESYYSDVQPEEREIRRRTLWLLFIAERNISIAYKLPVTIRTRIAFPSTIDSDSEHVLAAYQKLVTMFWEFDRSGVLELLDRCDYDFAVAAKHVLPPSLVNALLIMRKKLDEHPINVETMEDAQALDLLITRQWMRIILWRLTQTRTSVSSIPDGSQDMMYDLVGIVRSLLTEVADISDDAIEAHSSAFESKIFEIVTSIVSILRESSDASGTECSFAETIKEILIRLQSFLLRNEDMGKRFRYLVDVASKDNKLSPSMKLALCTIAQHPADVSNMPQTNPTVPFDLSDGSVSSAEPWSTGEVNLSPYSQWSSQEVQGFALQSANTLMSSPPQSVLRPSLGQSCLDVDWLQHGPYPSIDFSGLSSEGWHDMRFAFEGI